MRFRARDVFFEAERRVEEAAASGVDAEVLTPMPPLLRYDLPIADGLALARHVNEFVAQLCSFDPTRLIGLGMVPLQDPDAAAAELAAVGGQGLRGVEIASNVLDASIGDERFLPFFAEAERLGLAIFVHAMPTAGGGLPRRPGARTPSGWRARWRPRPWSPGAPRRSARTCGSRSATGPAGSR